MTSCDTNILLYAFSAAAPEHAAALRFLSDRLEHDAFAIAEHVLFEFYNLLRNPAVVTKPLSPSAAVMPVENLRSNP